MPRLTVQIDPEASEVRTAFPDGTIAISHIEAADVSFSKNGSPMGVFKWKLDEGPYAGREVSFHRVMLGGTTAAGGPMPMRQYCELVEACKVPWAINDTDPLVVRKFGRVKTDRGTVQFTHPDTGAPITTLSTNIPEDFIGKQARVRYTIRKQEGSDREFNEVAAVLPIS